LTAVALGPLRPPALVTVLAPVFSARRQAAPRRPARASRARTEATSAATNWRAGCARFARARRRFAAPSEGQPSPAMHAR